MKNLIGCSKSVETQKPYVAMLFVQLVYAGMALFSKAAISEGMNPYVFVAYRQGFATIALAPFAFLLDRNEALLSYIIVCKIFFISLFGITLSLNLYTYAMNYTSATFAAAATNTIPVTTFVMAILLRMESVYIKKRHGMAKVLGSLIALSGALVFALVKGPHLNFLNWSKAHHQETPSSGIKSASQGEFVKGSLIMLLSNITWSAWLILLGIIVTGITYWMQLWAIEKKGPVFTAMFTPLALIITAIVSALVWKEILHLGSVCGAILLVGGLYCVLWGKNKEARSEREAEKDQNSESKGEETGVVLVVVECNTHQ